jgi:hypothetical protein
MKDEIKLKLLDQFEMQFIGILLENNVVSYIKEPKTISNKVASHTFKNVKLNPKYKRIFNVNEKVDDEFVTKFRDLFPKMRKGTKAIVKNKLIRFVNNEGANYTLDEIYEVTQAYIFKVLSTSTPEMVRSANNIIYKKQQGGEDMLLLSLLEKDIVKEKITVNLVDTDDIDEQTKTQIHDELSDFDL